jgi:two-component system sensor histidine kinase BarA
MPKIAIIDDATDNRDFLYYLLKEEYEVLPFASGEDALRHFAHEKPDLVLMDIWLREMPGLEVLRRIREDHTLQNVPVIALTADAMPGTREKYLDAGFNHYVPKPIVDIESFMTTIRRILDEAQGLNG